MLHYADIITEKSAAAKRTPMNSLSRNPGSAPDPQFKLLNAHGSKVRVTLILNFLTPAFLLSANFFKISFSEKFFQEYHLSVKQIRSRSIPTFVESDLGPICLQRLCTDDTSRQRVKTHLLFVAQWPLTYFVTHLLITSANRMYQDQAGQKEYRA